MVSSLFDFAVTTIFARECLEGAIIIGQYRTIVLRGEQALAVGFSSSEALTEITLSAIAAAAVALLLIVILAIPLAILSTTFDPSTAYIIEGISKIVAAISLLQLSVKMPKMFGIYGSCKKTKEKDDTSQSKGDDYVAETFTNSSGLTRRSIRFNVAWNIWREVAECGIFLIPFFLNGQHLEKIPFSAVVGSIVGLACGYLIYWANQKLTNKTGLCVFAVMLLVILSAGLFTGGSHKLEVELGTTKEVWRIRGQFWKVERLPMTIFKPFGYNDSRTVLEIVCYWSWLLLSAILHCRKYLISPKIHVTKNGGSSLDLDNNFVAAGEEQRIEIPKLIDYGDQSTITGLTFGENTADGSATIDAPREEAPNISKHKNVTYVVLPEEAC